MKLLFIFYFLFIFSTVQAKPAPNRDYDKQNENIGLETEPTAARINEVEMVLGAIYGTEDQVSLSQGAEELANRNSQTGDSKRSRRGSGSSK